MKKIFRLSFVLFFVGCIAANAQGIIYKFGHVNSQQLLSEMPEFEGALKAMEKLQTDGNELLQTMQTEMQNQLTAYQNAANTMTNDQRAAKEAQLGEMQQKIQTYYQQTQDDMKQKELELTQPIIEKARKLVEEVGKENGFTYIFDTAKGELVYLGMDSQDIMPLLRKKLGIIPTMGNTMRSLP